MHVYPLDYTLNNNSTPCMHAWFCIAYIVHLAQWVMALKGQELDSRRRWHRWRGGQVTTQEDAAAKVNSRGNSPKHWPLNRWQVSLVNQPRVGKTATRMLPNTPPAWWAKGDRHGYIVSFPWSAYMFNNCFENFPRISLDLWAVFSIVKRENSSATPNHQPRWLLHKACSVQSNRVPFEIRIEVAHYAFPLSWTSCTCWRTTGVLRTSDSVITFS